MGLIVSKKSLFVAVLHFITAALMLGVAAYVLIGLFIGGLLKNLEGAEGFLAVFIVIFLMPSLAGMIISVPTFIFSGVKLVSQAQGQLPSKKSFIFTLVVKTIGFILMLPVLLFLFSLPSSVFIGVLHIVLLVLSLASSLLEAYVRRKP